MAESKYCWRCNAYVPMLNETEWAEIDPVYSDYLERIKRYRASYGCTLDEALKKVSKLRLIETHARLTGHMEINPIAIWHHRLSIYGSPCRACGKLLRTPQARFCAACGVPAI